MRVLLVCAVLSLVACGDHRHVDGRLSPYRYVILERVDERGGTEGDLRGELTSALRQVGFEVIDPGRAAADVQVANEAAQAYVLMHDSAYTARLEVTLRDLRNGAAAYEASLQKKGPNHRTRVLRMLTLDLQARYGGFSQREADLKLERLKRAP